MHRLNGTEDGYSLRTTTTQHMICLKESFLSFFTRMENEDYVISNEERLLIAHVDASLDELLHVYHKILIDQEFDIRNVHEFCKFCPDEE